MSELYQLYYDDKQKESILPFAIPYKTEGLTLFFENYWISELVKASQADRIAVCSHKLVEKMAQRVPPHTRLTEEALNGDYEVLSFTRNTKNHNMLQRAHVWHPAFTQAFERLWNLLGYKKPRETKQPVYQNHFSATSSIYKDYVYGFLDPAMEIIKWDTQLLELMRNDSGYTKLNKYGDMPAVKEKLNLDYYPICPFVLERCFSCWCDLKGIKVTYL